MEFRSTPKSPARLLLLSMITFTLHAPGTALTPFTRDDLFDKPRDFKKVSAVNKTLFNDAEKDFILNMHNSYRSVVYPTAYNMRELVWDSDLEQYAKNHTQLCTGAHSGGSMVKKWTNNSESWQYWYNMGEVLYYSYGSVYSVEEAFYLFWAEGLKYDIINNICTHPQTCGHYRVMVTAHSSRIGCALNICSSFSASKYPTPAVMFMCSYDGVYYEDVKPYTVGDTCTGCNYTLLGPNFQFCRYRLCIGPTQMFLKQGFNGSTSIIGFEYSDIIMVDSNVTEATTVPGLTTTTPFSRSTRPLKTTKETTSKRTVNKTCHVVTKRLLLWWLACLAYLLPTSLL